MVLDKSSVYFCSPVPSILLKSSLEIIHRRLAGFDFRKLLMWGLNQQTVFPHFQRWGSHRLTCARASPASHPHREESLSDISFNLPSVSLNTLNICHAMACFAAVTKKQWYCWVQRSSVLPPSKWISSSRNYQGLGFPTKCFRRLTFDSSLQRYLNSKRPRSLQNS